MKHLDDAKIIGGHGDRRALDFYSTPPEATQALIDFLKIPQGQTIWECASGEGHMAKVFRDNGYNTIETDIQSGTDFLTTPARECDWIITNPPFNISEQFIRRAHEIGKPFALLLKSQYWHSARRYPLFKEITPTYICPLTWRPDFTGEGNSLMDTIWCVWCGGETTQYIPLNRSRK